MTSRTCAVDRRDVRTRHVKPAARDRKRVRQNKSPRAVSNSGAPPPAAHRPSGRPPSTPGDPQRHRPGDRHLLG
ncbi:hypothetical protein Q5P01_021041 [Channa striata]|uniref:Uncharacterized protein n=1 Tax=Channa striata TaxID=64152 RepID=A0AA88LYH7_CHASR|nr:hypothetical protein Q5P01_021041 [Channa striata]